MHTPGKRGIVCAQASSSWAAAGLVLTPLLRILGPITAKGSPAQRTIQKRPLQWLMGCKVYCWNGYVKYNKVSFSDAKCFFIFIFYIFDVNAKQWSHAFMIIYSRLLEGILAFYPHFKKKFSNMFMFWNYFDPCPDFETRFSQNRVSMKNSICRKSSYARSNLEKKNCTELEFMELEFHIKCHYRTIKT